jgi:hypothetical protein
MLMPLQIAITPTTSQLRNDQLSQNLITIINTQFLCIVTETFTILKTNLLTLLHNMMTQTKEQHN